MKFEITLVSDAPASAASLDSLRAQLIEVIDEAITERQIEIPDAEIYDYDVTCEEF